VERSERVATDAESDGEGATSSKEITRRPKPSEPDNRYISDQLQNCRELMYLEVDHQWPRKVRSAKQSEMVPETCSPSPLIGESS